MGCRCGRLGGREFGLADLGLVLSIARFGRFWLRI